MQAFSYSTPDLSVLSVLIYIVPLAMNNAETTPAIYLNRTRIAPTPSGYLHLGNVLSFVVTATLAEQYEARILLRIDDLDRQRVQPAYIQDIFDTLEFLELPWHEGPRNAKEFEQQYSQVHRLPLYRQALAELKDKKAVFACDCSRSQLLQTGTGGYTGRCITRGLALDTAEINWRIRTDNDTLLNVKTLNKSVTAHLPPEQRDFVIRKKDGFPAYQLTSIVDDQFFDVDLIVRGMDLWPSTLAQLYLADVLNAKRFTSSTFYHHPLLTEPGGNKLSKSAGSTSVQYLRKAGKTATDIYTSIGAQAGITGEITNWRKLGNELLTVFNAQRSSNPLS